MCGISSYVKFRMSVAVTRIFEELLLFVFNLAKRWIKHESLHVIHLHRKIIASIFDIDVAV